MATTANQPAMTRLPDAILPPDPTLALPMDAPSTDDGRQLVTRDDDARGSRRNSPRRRRIVVAAALLGLAVFVGMPPSTSRSAAIADLDSIGRHPDFRWPVELTQTDQADWPADIGTLTPVDR
jgi:hypothetical protein